MPTSSAKNLFDAKSSIDARGVFTALVTPFKPDGSIDWKCYEQLLESQLAAGVQGVVPCGTTGESPTLSSDEKKALIETAVKYCKDRALVIAGTGSNDTRKTIHDSKVAIEAGVDALLIVTPYYNKPSQAGLEAHYQAVAEESSVPIILYNVPGRTNVSLAPATVARLARHPKIVGIKEASGNLPLFSEMRAAVGSEGKRFYFLSGDDPTFWPFLACGGDGVISVASNALPNCMKKLWLDWREGGMQAGRDLHQALSPLLSALFIEANPVPLKALLGWLGRANEKTRLPLVGLSPENAKKLREIWEALPPHLKKDQY